jgi:hypothetical protein
MNVSQNIDWDKGRQLYRDGGVNLKAAASIIGCPQERFRTFLANEGILRPAAHDGGPWSGENAEERIALLKALWQNRDLTLKVIAQRITAKYGRTVTKNSVKSKAEKMGLPPRAALKNGAPVAKSMSPTVQAERAQRTPPLLSAGLQLDPMPEDGTRFEDLKPGMCKWPLGGVRDQVLFFCGDKAKGNYCQRHHAISWRPRMRRGMQEAA